MQDHDRKDHPVATGLVDYFPDALLAIAAVSMEGARKHDTFGPDGRPTWDRSKSTDDADALARHFIDRGGFDTDSHRHSAKVAWRALAVLQRELDAAAEYAAVDGDDYALKGDGTTAKMAAVDAAVDEWSKHVNDIWGVDPAKLRDTVHFVLDKNGKVVATSDKPMSMADILKAAKAPIPQAPASPAPTPPKPAETFESWLNRRLGHTESGAPRDHYTVTQEYLLWAESLRT